MKSKKSKFKPDFSCFNLLLLKQITFTNACMHRCTLVLNYVVIHALKMTFPMPQPKRNNNGKKDPQSRDITTYMCTICNYPTQQVALKGFLNWTSRKYGLFSIQ